MELHAKEEANVESKKKTTNSHSLQEEKPTAKTATPEVLRYVPKSRRKERQSPFVECSTVRDLEIKRRGKMKEEDLEVIQGSLMMPLAKLNWSATIKQPLMEFTKPIQGSTIEGWFEPKSYKLLANSRYDFKNPLQLGEFYLEVI